LKACRPTSLVAALLAVLCACAASAEEKPLWELGVGVTALSLPDYRGSEQSSLYALPFPYIVYRGKIFRADRDGLRGALFDKESVELNISLGASVPVSSDENRARKGMPDLHPTVEAGPSIDFHLWRSHDRRYTLDLRLPLRAAVTVTGGPESIGLEFSPRLAVDITDVAWLDGWDLGLLAGPIFGSDRRHDYFYSVAPRYATDARPVFDAGAGYAGSQVLMSLSKRYPRLWLGAFARWDSLAGAEFIDSPLVTSRDYFAAGVAVAWVLRQSTVLVEDED